MLSSRRDARWIRKVEAALDEQQVVPLFDAIDSLATIGSVTPQNVSDLKRLISDTADKWRTSRECAILAETSCESQQAVQPMHHTPRQLFVRHSEGRGGSPSSMTRRPRLRRSKLPFTQR